MLKDPTLIFSNDFLYQAGLVQFPDIQDCPCRRALSTLFWLSESSLGTIFAQILRIPKFLVMFLQTVSLLMDSLLTIICTVSSHQLLHLLCCPPFCLLNVFQISDRHPPHILPRMICTILTHTCVTWHYYHTPVVAVPGIVKVSCPAEQEISGWFSAQDSCHGDCRATSCVQLPVYNSKECVQ